MKLLTLVGCGLFNHHKWVLIEEYEQMIKALIFTGGDRMEIRSVPNPFFSDKIYGKWKCMGCGQVSIGTLRNA